VSDEVRLLFLVKAAAGESGIDLIAELPTAVFDSARRIENRRDHFVAAFELRALPHTARFIAVAGKLLGHPVQGLRMHQIGGGVGRALDRKPESTKAKINGKSEPLGVDTASARLVRSAQCSFEILTKLGTKRASSLSGLTEAAVGAVGRRVLEAAPGLGPRDAMFISKRARALFKRGDKKPDNRSSWSLGDR
jgi:hypothetical protein